MCGRYAAAKDTEGLVEQFAIATVVDPAPPARYNVAPTTSVPMVVAAADGSGRQLRVARWGLVPSWAKDVSVGSRMINARWESLADKPAFRVPFARRRAILPADGYFEWYRPAPGTPGGRAPAKQPFYLHPWDGLSLALAGLFDFWRPAPDQPLLVSATILTTTAIGPMAALHERMPVVIPEELIEAWLDREHPWEDGLPGLRADQWAGHPVGTAVNSVAHDGPELIVASVASVPVPDLAGLAE